MGAVLELAESLWRGTTDTYVHHPFGPPYGIEQIARDTWFNKGVANTVVRETRDGLIVVDPGRFSDSRLTFEAVRSVTKQRLNTAVFTHGHVDHVAGVEHYTEEARSENWPPPRVVAHENVVGRFRRYGEMHGWNERINWRQFWGGAIKYSRPWVFRFPDITYTDRLSLTVGDVTTTLRHARGETDDHTWVLFPDTRVLCTGDLFIWAVPNAGNPQKVQRYAREWGAALRAMEALDPEVLAPGHGVPIIGAARVREALRETGALLESLDEQTVSLMNQGETLDTVLQTVRAPEALLRRPYLQPVYDEPEFIVRNVWRLYGGWYDGLPSRLKPAPDRSQAEEIARLAGGPTRLAARAQEVLAAGNLRLACHLADWAFLAAPTDGEIRNVVKRVYSERARAESGTFAKGIYADVVRRMGGVPEDGLLQPWLGQAGGQRFAEDLAGHSG